MNPPQDPPPGRCSTRQIWRVVVLAVALLIAQHGGLLHELDHHTAQADHGPLGEQALPVGEACELCFAYAPVGSAFAADTPARPLLTGLAFAAADASWSLSRAAEPPALRSRGPPGAG